MIQVNDEHIKDFCKILYELENNELPYGKQWREQPMQHHSFIENSVKPVLNNILEDWKIENAFKGGKKNIKLDKQLLNKGLWTGGFDEHVLNSFVCYFFYCFLVDYYRNSQPVVYLNRLVQLFEFIKEKDTPRDYVIEIEGLINYILKNHGSFDRKFTERIDERIVIQKKSTLSKVRCKAQIGLFLDFETINDNGEYVPLARYKEEEIDSETKNNNAISKRNSTKLDTISLPTTNTLLKEDLSIYYHKIVSEFSEIKLDVVNFRLPITSYIKTPIFENNRELVERKGYLENKLNTLLKDTRASAKKEDSIRKEIREIETILSKAHDILNVINLGKDIFIKAPAGSGKSTTLRWMAYNLAQTSLKNEQNKIIPIFIELKYYTSKVKNLNVLITSTLESYGLETSYLSEYHVILLLDGYDEYNLNTNDLFREIIEFKRENKNSLIIFTGRVQPNFSAHQVNYVVYRLAELNDKDIQTMFKSYLGEENGGESFELVENIGAKKYLQNPLYSAFVLVLIKDNLSKVGFDIEDIKGVIINKGLLLQTLIVDKFIRSYEADKAGVSYEKRVSFKRKEIDILSKLAFHMTFNLGDVGQIEMGSAESFFLKNKLRKNTIDDLINHSILKQNKGYISFDKKEIRLFFTAKELARLIDKHKHFIKYKELLKDNRIKRAFHLNGEMSTWEYIEDYLLGIAELQQLIDLSLFPKQPQRVILSDQFFTHFKLLLRKFDQGFVPEEDSPLSRKYILEIVRINTVAYKNAKENGYNSNYLISPYYLFRRIPRKFPFLRRYLSSEIISKANNEFLNRIFFGDYSWFTCIARRYDLGVSFTEYFESFKQTYIADDTHKDIFFLGVFDKGSNISFTKNDISYYIYQRFFNIYSTHVNKGLRIIYYTTGSYSRGKFIERKLREDFDSFIKYFFKQHPSPRKFTYLRLLFNLRESGWNYPIRQYSSYSKDLQDKVFNVLFDGIINIHLIKGYYNKYLFDLIENIEGSKLKKQLSDKALSLLLSNCSDNKKNINAIILILVTGVNKNADDLVKIVSQKQSPLNEIILEAIKKLTDKLRYNTKVFKQPYMSQFLSEAINLYPEKQSVLEYLLKEIHSTTPKLSKSVIGLTNTADAELYYAVLCFLSHNKPEEAVEFLIEQLGKNYYDSWCYDILYRINPRYHYEFKEKFNASSLSLYARLTLFESSLDLPLETSDIRELLYLCDDDCIDLFYKLLKSESHNKMLRSLKQFHSLKDLINEKVSYLFNYKITIGK